MSDRRMKPGNRIRALLATILWCCASGAVAAPAAVQVTFIGNDQYQPTGIEAVRQQGFEVSVYNLDAHRNLEKQLSEGLPVDDMERAREMARQRAAAVSQATWDGLFLGQVNARRWGIDRLPAVVFGNGEAVVYGITDLEEAIGYWREAREQDQ